MVKIEDASGKGVAYVKVPKKKNLCQLTLARCSQQKIAHRTR